MSFSVQIDGSSSHLFKIEQRLHQLLPLFLHATSNSSHTHEMLLARP